MILHISNVSFEDFSSYKCVAVNALGETDGIIKLYGRYQNDRTMYLWYKSRYDPNTVAQEFPERSRRGFKIVYLCNYSK